MTHSSSSPPCQPKEASQVYDTLAQIYDGLLCGRKVLEEDSGLDFLRECLGMFVQVNWLGPIAIPIVITDYRREEAIKALECGGVEAYSLVKLPWLLHLALEICKSAEIPPVWCLRVQHIWLEILDEPTEEILNTCLQLSNSLSSQNDGREGEDEDGLAILELALIMTRFGKQRLADEFLRKVGNLWGFKFHFSGILGRRTKHQSFDVTQLVVKTVESDYDGDLLSVNGSPENIPLVDEDLLDKVILTTNDADNGNVGSRGKLILLANVAYLLKFYAKDTSLINQCLAIVAKILAHPCQWSIYSTALYLRSKLEAGKNRLVERAALQFQALVDQLESEKQTPFSQRYEYFFAVPYPPVWELDREQALLFAGLGAFKTAAAIFERRVMTEELIMCLIQVGERDNAEALIKKGLDKAPNNPKLLCLLGDLHDNPSLYEKAWEASKGRFARAMRSLGMHYIKDNQNELALDCLQKALDVNGLFPKIWFLLGCVAMQLEDWHRALAAFSRTVADDPDNSDGWNNLAAVHMQLSNLDQALIALKQAAKIQFDSWKIWNNIFRVALQLGDLLKAIAAFRRVAEIRQKETPLEDLDVILRCFQTTIQKFTREDSFTKAVNRQLIDLLDNVLASCFSNNHHFWYRCATYADMVGLQRDVVEFYFKAYRAMQVLNIEKDESDFRVLIDCLRFLRDSINRLSDPDEAHHHRESLEMIIQNVLLRCQEASSTKAIYRELTSLIE